MKALKVESVYNWKLFCIFNAPKLTADYVFIMIPKTAVFSQLNLCYRLSVKALLRLSRSWPIKRISVLYPFYIFCISVVYPLSVYCSMFWYPHSLPGDFWCTYHKQDLRSKCTFLCFWNTWIHISFVTFVVEYFNYSVHCAIPTP